MLTAPANVSWGDVKTIPTEHDDPTNARILTVSEDLVAGFAEKPFHAIAEHHVSVTPLHIDMTQYHAIDPLARWLDIDDVDPSPAASVTSTNRSP